MSNTPKVTIAFSNGNLLQNIPAIDGQAGILATGTATAGVELGTPFAVNSLAEAEALGIVAEAVAAIDAADAIVAVAAVSGNMAVSSIATVDWKVYADGVLVVAYDKQVGDTTTALAATAIRAAINASTSTNGGFTAGGSGSNVTLTAPASAGATLNTLLASLVYDGGSSTSAFTGGVTAADAILAKPAVDTVKLHRALKEFYTEVGGNQEVFVMVLAKTVTMAQMLDVTDNTKANKLINFAAGKISVLGVIRTKDAAYEDGIDFLDNDVSAAVTASKTFLLGWNAKNYFFRVLIEGIVANGGSSNIYIPNTASNGYGGVVLGGTVADGSASVGLALGRRMRYACHIKIGKVANGPLSATAIYIGPNALKDVTNLDALHGKGYISFVTYPNKAGFFFGIDQMASNDDYRLLVNGGIVDAAARIANIVYTDDLEGEVDTEANGTIQEAAAVHLEEKIKQQVNTTIGDRLSGFDALVDRTVNIINTSRCNIKLRVRPKGYLTFIDIDLGLTAGS